MYLLKRRGEPNIFFFSFSRVNDLIGGKSHPASTPPRKNEIKENKVANKVFSLLLFLL
jgi:hypothetical protein